MLGSKKISFGEKSHNYFIGYLYNGNKVKPLHKRLPNKGIYVKMEKLDDVQTGCSF